MDKDKTQLATGFLRLTQVLKLIPVSKSTWYRGMKLGIYPPPVKLGLRASGWKLEEIKSCIDALGK